MKDGVVDKRVISALAADGDGTKGDFRECGGFGQ